MTGYSARVGDESVKVRKGRGAEERSVGDDAVVAAKVGESPDGGDEGRAVRECCISDRKRRGEGSGRTGQ